jgi:hypothetical protein
MTFDRIFSMANRHVALEFLAMERSLRATGCRLPLTVIPFGEPDFDLPRDAAWMDISPYRKLLEPWSSGSAAFRKLVVFLQPGAVFFDADITHLRNPEEWLAEFSPDEFLVADTEVFKNKWTFTPRTAEIYRAASSNWQLSTFNSGFFAFQNLRATEDSIAAAFSNCGPDFLINSPTPGEQAALNYLVFRLGWKVVNACLPPYSLESTMAVDYDDNYRELLNLPNSAPFIHFAGGGRDLDKPIAQLMLAHLSAEQATEMISRFEERKRSERRMAHWPLWVRALKRLVTSLDSRFEIAWSPRIAKSRRRLP